MALFSWFFKKPDALQSADAKQHVQQPRQVPASAADLTQPQDSSRPSPYNSNRTEERKVKRHSRRDQLYVAIREALTRAGVLSASFKFKVLSLDQNGNQFLVMIDLHPSLGFKADKIVECEELITHTAKTLFEILVTAVYWRLDTKADATGGKRQVTVSQPAPLVSRPAPLAYSPAPATVVKKPPAPRYDPIEEDEMAAFKRALASSSPQKPMVPEPIGKTRSGPHSYTLITGFEDTEMPETSALPALSATQYGDLN